MANNISNPASRPNKTGHLFGKVREAERACQDTAALGVLNALLGDLKHDAPRAGVPDVGPTQPALDLGRTLQVFMHGARAGDLHNESGVWSFCYARAWASAEGCCALARGMPLQTRPIVDSDTSRPVQRYFESLLPHDGALTAFAERAQVDAADSFSLLAYCGAKSAGYHLGDYPDFIEFCLPRHKLAQNASRR